VTVTNWLIEIYCHVIGMDEIKPIKQIVTSLKSVKRPELLTGWW
jgi:hypothetical protein